MSLSDYLKCPGPERSMAAIPETYPCPDCGTSVEIWSDESKRRCPECHRIIYQRITSDQGRSIDAEPKSDQAPWRLKQIIRTALALGASDAEVIPSVDIEVEEDLADLCKGDPRCENYGLAASCPPHVSGPSGFRKLQSQSQYTVVVRLDVPSSALFSDQRRDIMQLLHEIVSGVEQAVLETGYKAAASFAGGSCKKIFCFDQPECQKLSAQGKCRHPESARPSMSGFGIHVAKLIQSAGWELNAASRQEAENPESMTWVAGIILILGDRTPHAI